jgi:hypothetical protein
VATKASITPGEWTVESDGTTVSMGGQCVIVAPAPDYAPISEQRANASLIAAAPRLLRACRKALRDLGPYFEDDDPHPTFIELEKTLRAAIARATGNA